MKPILSGRGMVASSVIDVILGEAGGRTEAQRYADMVAIASVIQNRANLSGLDPLSIISVQSEFNAYGKALPKGVEAHRDLAEAAWNQVQTTGPVHNATYYATPKAKDGLPNSLRAETTTTAHEYFSDPQARSFRTAQGFVAPGNPPMQAFAALPDLGPIPSARPAAASSRQITPGLGLANLLSPLSSGRMSLAAGLEPGQIDVSPLATPGKQRSQVPTSGIVGKVAQAADSVIPGAITSLYSGMEPRGAAPAGARDRHPRGFAGDFDFFNAAGNRITDPVAMHDIAMTMAANHKANIGYGPEYMGIGRMHIDTMPLSQFPGGPQWASMGKEWAGNLNFARETGIGPTPYTNAPIPTARPETPNPMAAPVDPVDRAPLPAIGALPAAPSARQAQEQSMDDFYDALGRTKELDRFGNVYTYDPRSKEYTAVTNRNVTQRAIEDQSMRALNALPVAVPPVQRTITPPVAPVAPVPPQIAPVAPVAPRTQVPAPQITPITQQPPAAIPGSFPAAPPAPGRQAAKSALTGAIKGGMMGGPVGLIAGALLGPALGRMGRNLSNRTNPFAGMFDDYRGLGSRLGGLGNLFGGIGLLSTPNYGATPFGVGSGMSAISGVFGMPAGATAYSRSNPEVSFTSLGNGMVSRSNSKTGVSYSMSAGDYEGPSGGRSPGGKSGGKGTGGLY